MGITLPQRAAGSYYRADIQKDVLYGHYRHKEISMTLHRVTGVVSGFTDSLAKQLCAMGIVGQETLTAYETAVTQEMAPFTQWDPWGIEQIYSRIHSLRKQLLGIEALEKYRDSITPVTFAPAIIDQSAKRDSLLQAAETVIFALCDMSMLHLLQKDLASCQGKRKIVLCSREPGNILPTEGWFSQKLPQAQYCADFQTLPEKGLLVFYGEEGLLECRCLTVDSVVYARPRGMYARAVTTQLAKAGDCLVYIPKGFDITPYVPLTERTMLSYLQLSQLWRDHGDGIYQLPVAQLYTRYPQYFLNIYQNESACREAAADYPIRLYNLPMEEFDRQRDRAIKEYLDGFEGVTYHAAYFDENLERKPICYDSSQKQPGILVHGVRIRQARQARVVPCGKQISLREKFANEKQTALVSNFLFFMTPRLGRLYNTLRQDRPCEQADAAAGHLDYMLCYENGKRIETFPLFRKSCIAMKKDGSFLFFNFRLGGGQIRVGDQAFRWEADCVDAEQGAVRVYTPYASNADPEGDRNTYRKLVGQGRVNLVILQDKLCALRRGDVILPSVGVVVSLEEEAGLRLIEDLGVKPLEDGYYDVSGLEMTVQLDPPAQISAETWQQVQWAYGGGLSLILDGKGLCDGEDMEGWFVQDGWMSPLSRQTQESALHTMAKHPRTALGVTANGDTVILVFSGRTWRSAGADYREMIQIARALFPDVENLMNMDGGGSAVLGLVVNGSFMELSCPSTSGDSTVGMVRPVNTVLYIPVDNGGEKL